MLLDVAGVDVVALGVHAGRCQVQPLVHVGEEEGGADGGLVVHARAAVAMPARPDLEVERAVYPILLCAEDGCQMLRHAAPVTQFQYKNAQI